jgi:oxidoreductase
MPSNNKQTASKTAYLVGATGLIGSHLLKLLLESDHYHCVIVQARSQCPKEYEGMLAGGRLLWFGFDDEIEHAVDDFYCTLGTTQKKSGKSGLASVDRDLVIKTASTARSAGATLFSVVSALGASERSLFFYNGVKGQMESGAERLNPQTLHLWQPSLLLGERSEHRAAEGFASVFMKARWLGDYSARDGATVAKAMINAAQVAKPEHIRFKVRSIDTFSKLTD